MAGLVKLDEGQLRRLALLIRNQEILRINNIQFRSEYERVQYILDCRANFDTVESLFNNAAGLVEEQKDDQTKSLIAHDFNEQVIGLVANALQAIRNYTVRKEFLSKVVTYTDDAMKQLRLLDPADEVNVSRLAEDAKMFREAINNFNDKHGSRASDFFAQQINEQGISFDELVFRYMRKLGLPGLFKDLSEEDKFLVYEDIIRDSGRGEIIKERSAVTNTKLVAGVALLGFTAAIMVWDIYSTPSKEILEQVTRGAANLASAAGGTALGNYLAAALKQSAAIKGGAALITVAGFIFGAAAGFLLATVAGVILDAIFSSGGHVPSTQNFQIFIAPMPDGLALARQISLQQ